MRCKSCHYDLRNLSDNRCPECGRVFDPNDRTTFRSDREQSIWARFPDEAGVILIVLAVVAGVALALTMCCIGLFLFH